MGLCIYRDLAIIYTNENWVVIVVYFDYLSGAARTRKLVKLLFQRFSSFFIHFLPYLFYKHWLSTLTRLSFSWSTSTSRKTQSGQHRPWKAQSGRRWPWKAQSGRRRRLTRLRFSTGWRWTSGWWFHHARRLLTATTSRFFNTKFYFVSLFCRFY